ncbi:MAG TPA: SIR2 family protein [Rhodocyclaceae bacterium]
MITSELKQHWISGIADGSIVPYLGPGVLADSVSTVDGRPIPATSDQLILAMNNGQPMAPKLMYEFPRAAMNVELKRGRSAVSKFLDATYGQGKWTRAAVHDWIKAQAPRYVVDINRDTQLLDSYAAVPHILIQGCARISGTAYRFKIFQWDGGAYKAVTQEEADPNLPVLFKPMGTPVPESTYIASDADYVDYITELMGGFAIPSFVKAARPGKQYLLIGMRLNRDSERMVMSDIIYGSAEQAGWVLIQEPTDKERRYCKKMKLEIVEASLQELLGSGVGAAA